MPQIGQLTEDSWYLISQIFWLLLVFGGLFFVVGRGMVPKVMSTVDLRDRTIADNLAAAKAARDAADAAEDDWRQRQNAARADAQALVNRAKEDAAKRTEARLAEVDAGLDTRMAEAERGIADAKSNALREVEGVAVEATQDVVQRLTGQPVDNDVARNAVKAHLHG